MTETAPSPALPVSEIGATAEVERLLERLEASPEVHAGGLWGSSQALILAQVSVHRTHPIACVLSTDAEAEAFAADLEAFGCAPLMLPSREAGGPPGARKADPDALRARLAAARALARPVSQRPKLIVASLLALLQPVPEPETITGDLLTLRRGDKLNVSHVLRRLVEAGWTRQPLVERAGEISLRGDILDVWPFAADEPLRIELFDDEIESLRRFDPSDQRSVESLQSVELLLAADPGGVEDGSGVQPVDLFAGDVLFVEIEPLRIEDREEGLSIQSGAHSHALERLRTATRARRKLTLQSLPARDVAFDTRSVQGLALGVREAPAALTAATEDGSRAIVLCQTPAEEHRFLGVLEEAGAASLAQTRVGSLSKGFRMPAAGLVVVNHREIAGVGGVRRAAAARPAHKSRALQSFFDLKPGDFVVHAVHGLALYKGLERVERSGAEEEYLHLEFDGEVNLFVPVTRIDLVQRYIGTGSGSPSLDKIGGQSFRKRRERVERALFDLAAELLEVQAKRELRQRDAWVPEPELTSDMVGSFPWVDTEDQAKADVEITSDLESDKPMDRLLCGDVGFGKTELAVRAAFRVVSGGGQVALLVPTTVLAHQHLETFRERLADFPVTVEVLSRMVTGKAAKDVVQRVANGSIDILVGTHRILSKDVNFKRLGLVIIDEEQRFGVTHKEHFKTLRSTVDVLTLSATPIPRTLHMSLAGVRDISALATPPPGRQEINTRLVDSGDDELLREALLFEKNRGGQAFFLHNRVLGIQGVAHRLAELAPQCSFTIGHGQMLPRQMEAAVESFACGDVDVLVATTIVENGLDIPAAGTIFIDQAQNFGLSELHQLRGRVGRGAHKAYCYLLVDRHKPIPVAARERLKALEELNQLGAGFAISMKDLELRGAGNILGPQQSGHIAAVGYDMYCRLLKQTVERVQAGLGREVTSKPEELAPGVDMELGLKAYLPEEWIPSQGTRVEVLRALEAITTDADAENSLKGLRDRFGRVPAEAETLVETFRLRARALALGISRLAWRSDRYLVEFTDRVLLEGVLRAARRGKGVDFRALRTGVGHLMIPERERAPTRAVRWLEGLLQDPAGSSRIHPTDSAG